MRQKQLSLTPWFVALARLGILVAAWCVCACGSPGAVAVTAAVASPAISVDGSSPLAAQLTGAFRLHLALGEHASSGTEISISQGNLALVKAADQATLVVLKFTTDPAAPYHLDPGQKLEIAVAIRDRADAAGQLVTKDEQNALCAARAAVQIAGSISDSSGSIPVHSTAFTIDCP
jgi:hypothetical protein